jgi:hypothetical protein
MIGNGAEHRYTHQQRDLIAQDYRLPPLPMRYRPQSAGRGARLAGADRASCGRAQTGDAAISDRVQIGRFRFTAR